MEEFAMCARAADKVILLPVHAAGEAPLENVSSEVLAQKMKPRPLTVGGEDELVIALEDQKLTKDDCILCLGAGTISAIAKHLGQH
jgi:UDP-N-acetylmuramate--alanine ligase